MIRIRHLTGSCDDRLLLTDDENRRADSFRFEDDRVRWIAARAALRTILAEVTGLPAKDVPILIDRLGKPHLAHPFDGIHFNLSHCRDLALIAVGADGPLGIDIEPADRAGELIGYESSFCHPLEAERLPTDDSRPTVLLDLWTAKESLLKALGTGFSVAPETVCLQVSADTIALNDEHNPVNARQFRIERLRHPLLEGHVAMVCVPSSTTEIRFANDGDSTSAIVSG